MNVCEICVGWMKFELRSAEFGLCVEPRAKISAGVVLKFWLLTPSDQRLILGDTLTTA